MTNSIETLARPDRGSYYTRVLWSEIVPGLWQGGTHDDDTVHDARISRRGSAYITPEDFDTVITLYAWAQPVDWFVKELRYGFWDSGTNEMDEEKILDVARLAYKEWKSGQRVLIRCQAGLNRSGLITALVLMMDGLSAKEAIELQRDNRCDAVLCNRDFENWLCALDRDTLN